jgi:hypothetical protein
MVLAFTSSTLRDDEVWDLMIEGRSHSEPRLLVVIDYSASSLDFAATHILQNRKMNISYLVVPHVLCRFCEESRNHAGGLKISIQQWIECQDQIAD